MTLNNSGTNSRLAGKNAIVTGGASGIGRAIASKFAGSGAYVHILDIDIRQSASAVSEILAAGGVAVAHECDVSIQEMAKAVLHNISRRGPIHILVNNVGIANVGNLENTDEAEFERLFNVNVKGCYNAMLACMEHLKLQGGVILNLASIAATVGLPDRFAYSMSKGAVLAMTYSVAKDYLAYKVRCNCISPARVHTPFVDGFLKRNYPGREEEMFAKLSQAQPLGRMATPEEVAALALFLCSDEASFITGVDYPIDGGFINLRN